MDTAPLPAVPADSTPRPGPVGAARLLEILAGLASAGMALLGLALVVLQIFAPELAPGTGLSAATGPTWPRALAALGVGVAGELVVFARARLPFGARVWASVGVLVAVGAVLWFCWWR